MKPAATTQDSAIKKKDLIEKLKLFLQKGFQNPVGTFEFLKSKGMCSECLSDCSKIIECFSIHNPWNHYNQFSEWVQRWYPSTKEEPLDAMITIPLIMQFLISEKVTKEASVGRRIRMEFKGKVEGREDRLPPCIWKGAKGEGSCITLPNGKQMCCDFLLLPPFPVTVVEVSLVLPKQEVGSNFTKFKKSLRKCEEWLKTDKKKLVERDFNIEGLEYALALLIDLTGTAKYRNEWESKINEADWAQKNILAWHISP